MIGRDSNVLSITHYFVVIFRHTPGDIFLNPGHERELETHIDIRNLITARSIHWNKTTRRDTVVELHRIQGKYQDMQNLLV